MTTTTSVRQIEQQMAAIETAPERSGPTHSGSDRLLNALRRFWRDQLYLQQRLLASQRQMDDGPR